MVGTCPEHLNTEVSVNEAETIQECVQSKDLLSQRTILANHPWVKSVDDEIERIDEELGGVDGREAGEVSPFGAMPQTAYAPTPSAGQSPATPRGSRIMAPQFQRLRRRCASL